MKWIDKLSWPVVIIIAATLGLAPFSPQPHVIQKLAMLFNGSLIRPVDIFDLFLHGTPWILLLLKALRQLTNQQKEGS